MPKKKKSPSKKTKVLTADSNVSGLAASLRKRAEATRKRSKPREDASQTAARILREATLGK